MVWSSAMSSTESRKPLGGRERVSECGERTSRNTTHTKTRKSLRPVRMVLPSSARSASPVATVASWLFFSVGVFEASASWLTMVSVSALENRAPAPASFSGMMGVCALLLVAVGANELSMEVVVESGEEGEKRGEAVVVAKKCRAIRG
jgi:hypothetical protein